MENNGIFLNNAQITMFVIQDKLSLIQKSKYEDQSSCQFHIQKKNKTKKLTGFIQLNIHDWSIN